MNEFFLTIDTNNGSGPTVLASAYETREIAKDWAQRFQNDPCHSQPGWKYDVVRIGGGQIG